MIEQRDREAAADYYASRGLHGVAAKIRSGKHDGGWPSILAAFSRYRRELVKDMRHD